MAWGQAATVVLWTLRTEASTVWPGPIRSMKFLQFKFPTVCFERYRRWQGVTVQRHFSGVCVAEVSHPRLLQSASLYGAVTTYNSAVTVCSTSGTETRGGHKPELGCTFIDRLKSLRSTNSCVRLFFIFFKWCIIFSPCEYAHSLGEEKNI